MLGLVAFRKDSGQEPGLLLFRACNFEFRVKGLGAPKYGAHTDEGSGLQQQARDGQSGNIEFAVSVYSRLALRRILDPGFGSSKPCILKPNPKPCRAQKP